MKSITYLFIISFCFLSFTLFSQNVKLSLNSNSATTEFSILSKSSTEFKVLNSISYANLDLKTNQNDNYYKFILGNYNSNTANIGKADLPVVNRLIEIPEGANPVVKIISYDEEIIYLSDYGITDKIYPVQPSYSKSEDPANMIFQKDDIYYQTDAFSYTPLAEVDEIGTMRGVNLGRLTISPFSYNPVQNILKVYNNVVVEVVFENANLNLSLKNKKDKYSPFFEKFNNKLINYIPNSSKDQITQYPVKFVIVADRMFETQLQPYIQWKTRKGFNVIEAYTDMPAVGSTTSSIKTYLQGLYTAGTPSDPAPSFVLLVGDVAQVPTWDGNTSSHKTDLYYVEYTGDYLPDVYIGRFSAQNTSQLQPQIDKTLMYEQYTMPDPSYLGEVLLVAGVDVDGGANTYSIVHGNGELEYGIDNYFNAAHGITVDEYLYPESEDNTNDPLIRSDFNDGVSFANYTAHCSSVGWANPSFTTSHVPSMTNDGKYGLMVGNCCQSNTINDNECFGEAVLRKANGGAVGYIGGTNYSYWDEDYHWGVGASNIQSNPSVAYNSNQLGAYDRAFHDNGEAETDWFVTNAAFNMAGNLAVEQANDGMKDYYWEIYQLSGDPSVMNYFGVPPAITATYTDPVNVGTTSLTVNTESYAYVAISQNNVLLDAQYTGSGTSVTLNFPAFTVPGTADVVVTKQNRAPYIGTLTIINATTPPVADFIADQTTVTAGTVINFTDLSTDYPASWSWDFGGGATNSTVQNPSVMFSTPGTYTVSLYVQNGAGNDTETKIDYIVVNAITTPPVADFVGTPTTISVGGTVDFTDLSTNLPNSWTWTFDGGTPGTSTSQNPTGIIYNSPGVYDVTLEATNAFGSDTEIKTGYITVEVPDPCAASSSATNYEYISNVTFNTIDNTTASSGYADYTAMSTDLNIGDTYSFTVTYTDNYATNEVIVWIDWNMDGDFYDTGEEFVMPQGAGQNSPYSMDITVPGTAMAGPTNMRVRLHDTGWNPMADPCGSSGSGEVEDYSVNIVSSATPPTASFISDVTSTCTGVISFTDQSTGGVSSWLWDFGDGNTSTAQNPVYTYTTNGTYSVSLTATNAYGNDTYTETNYITVALPTAPATTDDSRCGDGSVTLTATGTGTLEWYDAPTGGTLVNTGASFTTPILTATTTYYVQDHDVSYGSSQYVGETNNTGNGANFTNAAQSLIFDVTSPVQIVSVEVNATGAGPREIELRDNTSTVIQSATVNIPDGISRISLNFDVQPGTDYELGLSGTSDCNLFRNNAGCTYPYEIAGLVSITQSTAGTNPTGFYYFFYDWEVQPINDCISSRTTSTATIETQLPVDVSVNASSTSVCTGENVTFTATPTNGGLSPTYQWQINGSNAGTGLTYSSTTLNDGDIITCILTSSEVCNDGPATSSPITMTVSSALPVSVSIAGNNSICAGETISIDATSNNEGPAASYEWFINGSSVGNDNSNYTSTGLSDGDIVTCVVTSSLSCATGNPATSNPLTIVVNPNVNVSLSIAGNNTICAGDNTTFTATPTGGGTTPTYDWQVNGSSVGSGTTFSSTTLADGDVVTCILSSSEVCNDGPATSNSVTMTVGATLPVSVAIAGQTSICYGEYITFNATPTNGGTTPIYQWQVNGSNVGTGSSYSTSTLNDGDVVSCTLTSSETCATSNPANSNTLTMTVEDLPTAGFYYATNFLEVTLTNNSTNATTYSWDFGDGNTSTAQDPTHTYAADGTYTITLIATNSCGSDTSTFDISVIGVGVADIPKTGDIEIYPNPTKGIITIDFNNSKIYNVEIYDVIGKKHYSKQNASNELKLNLGKLNKGVYFVKLINGVSTSVYKVVLD